MLEVTALFGWDYQGDSFEPELPTRIPVIPTS